MQVESHGGRRYLLLFIDDCTRMSWVYLLKFKHETFSCFQKFLAFVKRQTCQKLKIIRIDRGGEFVSREFDMFCSHNGIKHELTTSYTPQQNGVTERKNRTLIKGARSMLNSTKLPNSFWAEELVTAVYLSNISTTHDVNNKTPHEA